MTPRNFANPFIMINHAQQEFLLNFGFLEAQLPIPLGSLFGPTTERSKIVRLEKCMLSGKSFSEFMNLHKSNGGSLSCYVSLLCLTNQQTQSPTVFFASSTERTLSRDSSEDIVKYGVLTIRSASVVGNSKYSGIGLMGTERVPRERIQEMPGQSSIPSTSITTE